MQLSPLVRVAVLISGCNRRGVGGTNLVRISDSGRYIVVLNPVDGHVNYLLGSPLFGASITAVDVENGQASAFVYDGLSDEVFHVVNGRCSFNDSRVRCEDGSRHVIGLGNLYALKSKALSPSVDFSWRSLGSTTLSILEVLRRRMDLYFSITKVWNFFWALGASGSGAEYFENLRTGRKLNKLQIELARVPEATVPLLCYRERRIAQRMVPMLRIRIPTTSGN